MEERTVNSKFIHRGRILTLRVDEVILPNGKRTAREIVEHPRAVAAVPILDGKVILVRQFRKPVEEAIYEIPAGKLEPGEEPHRCMERELEEEIGYRARKLEKLLSYYPSPGFSAEVIHIFSATDLEKGEQKLEKDEFLEPVTLQFEEALRMIEEGRIKDSKTIIGLLLTKNCNT
ncbi:NUDIX hydrolase [candidate division NPL-UPA2 bacterium]|nr:NUDIX hydrolase [candidate division NPL-UPA2 bacterium]